MAKGPRKVVIGDAVRDRRRLWAYCELCGHQRHLDPAELARRVGYDTALVDLRKRMKCTECGGREVDVRVEMPSLGVVARHTASR